MGRLDANGDGALDLEEFQRLSPAARLRRLFPGRAEGPQGSAGTDSGPVVADLSGRSWTPMRPAEGTKANVLYFVVDGCPVANQFAPEMSRIARDYADKGVAFLLVQVDPDVSSAQAAASSKELSLDLPIVLDGKQDLVARTGAKISPEAAVVAADGSIAYCGRIDDRFGKLGRQRPEPATRDLLAALDAVLKGESIAHSRVARSNIWGLLKLGAKVILCGPPTLVPRGMERLGCEVAYRLDDVLHRCDVINVLRIQFERQQRGLFPSVGEYSQFYMMTQERVKKAKDDLLILAPGPINRGVELTPEVADGKHSAILDQVSNGLAVRMAVLYLLSGKMPAGE